MKRKVHLWHDLSGKIIAWGYASSGKNSLHAVPLAGQGNQVISVDVEEKDMQQLHVTHRVDVQTFTLVRRT